MTISLIANTGIQFYNPKIQISEKFETKRPKSKQNPKTKRLSILHAQR